MKSKALVESNSSEESAVLNKTQSDLLGICVVFSVVPIGVIIIAQICYFLNAGFQLALTLSNVTIIVLPIIIGGIIYILEKRNCYE